MGRGESHSVASWVSSLEGLDIRIGLWGEDRKSGLIHTPNFILSVILWLRLFCLHFIKEESKTQREKLSVAQPQREPLVLSLWEWCSPAVWGVSPAWLQGAVLHQDPAASRQGYKEFRVLIHVQDLFYSSRARKSVYEKLKSHIHINSSREQYLKSHLQKPHFFCIAPSLWDAWIKWANVSINKTSQ